MSKGKSIPTFDLYKTLTNSLCFEFSNLEESYQPYNAAQAHRHNYYEILVFNKSGGEHEIDFNSYPILKNSLHFISPEQVHLLKREKKVTGYVISFTKEFFLEEPEGSTYIDSFPFFNSPFASPVIRLNEPVKQKEIADIILKIQTEYSSPNNDKGEMLLSCLSIFLIMARRLYVPGTIAEKTFSSRTELTYQFKKLVEKNFRQHKLVSDYADMLKISPGHLNDTIQKDTGKTASDMIHERIILEAKRLLYHSPKSVKEIGYELLYDDPSYFIRFFKKHADMTPEQFRAHIREKDH